MVNKEKAVRILLNTFEEIKAFANTVTKFESDVNIYYTDSKSYDAKSILAVLAVDNSKPKWVEIVSNEQKEINVFKEAMKKFEYEE